MKDAEASQRFVGSQMEYLCRECGLSFWRCAEQVPPLESKTLFVGVAHYDRKDLELLDALAGLSDAAMREYGAVMVFSIGDCGTIDDIRRVVPGIDQVASQNPLVVIWNKNAVVKMLAGTVARRWFYDNFGESR